MPEKSPTWWCLRIAFRDWAQDALVSFLSENGCLGTELLAGSPDPMLLAYCEQERACRKLRSMLEAYGKALEEIHGNNPILGMELEKVEDPGWAHAWKAHFKPARVSNRLAVRPPWDSFEGPEGIQVIQIEPGQAFGTGLHETTRLCLAWLDDLLTGECMPESALDLGTGTGILALAMALLGVGKVVALDLDPLAVEAAKENIRLNGMGARIQALQGSLDSLAPGGFPLVVANLTGSALRRLSRELAAVVRVGGILLVSGILAEEAREVAKSFQRAGMKKLGLRRMGDWRAMLWAVAK